jgi:translation initiation factor IF-2
VVEGDRARAGDVGAGERLAPGPLQCREAGLRIAAQGGQHALVALASSSAPAASGPARRAVLPAAGSRFPGGGQVARPEGPGAGEEQGPGALRAVRGDLSKALVDPSAAFREPPGGPEPGHKPGRRPQAAADEGGGGEGMAEGGADVGDLLPDPAVQADLRAGEQFVPEAGGEFLVVGEVPLADPGGLLDPGQPVGGVLPVSSRRYLRPSSPTRCTTDLSTRPISASRVPAVPPGGCGPADGSAGPVDGSAGPVDGSAGPPVASAGPRSRRARRRPGRRGRRRPTAAPTAAVPPGCTARGTSRWRSAASGGGPVRCGGRR